MHNQSSGYGYYGYPPPVDVYGLYGGPSGSLYGNANPPPPGVEEPDVGAALAEEFIHRCKSDQSRTRSQVSRRYPEDDFIRKCRLEREHSVNLPPREEEFIRKCRSVSRPPNEEGFVRKPRSDREFQLSRQPYEGFRKCRVDRERSVSPLPPEEEFIRQCKSGSRPPAEDEFIRQCRAGSRPPNEDEFIRQCRAGSRKPSKSRQSRSPIRSSSRIPKSPSRHGRSRSRSPIRSGSRLIRSRSRTPSMLNKSPVRSTIRSIRSHSRSPVKSVSSVDSRHPSSHRGSRTLSPYTGSKSGRSISPRRERQPSPVRSQLRRSRSRERCRSRDSHKSHSSNASDETGQKTKRRELVNRWRMNCFSKEEVSSKLKEISKMKPEEILEKEKTYWTRTAPADLYYEQTEDNPRVYRGTDKLISLCKRFDTELIQRAAKANDGKPPYQASNRRHKLHHHRCCAASDSESDGSSEESGDEGLMEELERKRNHPDRLHPELWYNDQGEMNDGPLCRCSAKAKRSGIRHNIYAGELNLDKCNVLTNNADRLHHYRITVSPPNNFLIKTPTIIEHDSHEYIFEGFSMFSHKPLENLPVCKVIRFNIEYTILYIKEKHPEHFTIRELDLFYDFLFKEVLELVDLDFKAAGDSDGCSQFHFMPRFVRELPENGKELLSMNQVLNHLLLSSKPLISMENLAEIVNLSNYKWQNYVDDVKGMVVTYPGKKPCSLRVDQLDRDQSDAHPGQLKVPEIVHFGIRPPQLSYAGNPEYQKAWRDYVKFRHLLANMPKASFEDKRKLESKENKLQEMRTLSKMKRDVTIAISSEGFYRTGIMCDIVQHAMLIPVLVSHLRFHRSLDVLEADIKYTFSNRSLLQLALTHPSYRENFGTNPDHARNSLTNCSIRQPEYGDRRIHYLNTRKRGINTLINIMSRFGKNRETESNITHNERLEFLGDAVVEFVTSIHLFHLFPRLEEGGLATYRAAIVQNQHLAVLAKKLGLDGYMLYAHGSDLCHDLELRHAMANCFESLMGALFLDGGIDAADRVFGESLFKESPTHLKIWEEYPPHPLQEQEPNGDRQWIDKFQILQNLTKFEDSIGVQFTHIRLLARAFTDRSIGFTNLTLGSNQRLEFLGDTVLQLIASDYLYKYFPEHHEGHLSLLRSSLVNNRTQAVVCDDLGIGAYAIYATPKAELKTKDRADLLEAFLGALYVDKGLQHCEVFCNVCFFPRLHHFIMHQDWNDPKSKLQQCCLTLRSMEGGEPEIPVYKVIECMGPTNTRLYTVAVYFKGKRLAQATGHSIQQAEMNAAKEALDNSQKLFPQLDHQKRVIAKSIKQDPLGGKDNNKRGQNDADCNRKNSRVRNVRGRSASVRSSKSRDFSATGPNQLQSREPRRDEDPSQTRRSSTLDRSATGEGDYRSYSNIRRTNQQRSPSSQGKLSRTRSPSPGRSVQLRRISSSGPRGSSQLRSTSPQPRSPSLPRGQSIPKRPATCKPRSPSPLRECNTPRSPSLQRELSRVGSRSPNSYRSPSSSSGRSRLRSPSPVRKSSRSPPEYLLEPSGNTRTLHNGEVLPKKGFKSFPKTSDSVSTGSISHSRSTGRNNKEILQKHHWSQGAESAGMKTHEYRTRDFQEECQTEDPVGRDKPSGSKSKGIEQNCQPTHARITDQRKRPRVDDSPGKTNQVSSTGRKKRRSKSQDRESATHYRTEEEEKRALDYYGYPKNSQEIDFHLDYHPGQANDQPRIPFHERLEDRAREGSYNEQTTTSKDCLEAQTKSRQQQPRTNRQEDKTKSRDTFQGQYKKKASSKSHERREPSDEGEIFSESSADSRYS